MGGCIGSESQYISCQQCGHIYPRSQSASHACNQKRRYSQNHIQPQAKKSLRSVPQITPLTPYFPPQPNYFEPSLYQNQVKQYQEDLLQVKVPANPERTIYKWKKESTYVYPPIIKTFSPQLIRLRTFQEKLLWFRLNIESLRISWEHGHEKLKINRGQLLKSCREGLNNINWRKQVKIIFDDESVEDAGGVIRQWMNLVIKQIFSPETGVFQLCETQQTAYKFVWDKELNQKKAIDIAWILGVVIGKALFDRISIDCHLNRTIIRQICSSIVFIHDMFSFDRMLFESWMQIIKEPNAQNLYLTMSELKVYKDGTKQEIDLAPNGKEIFISDKNKRQYITLLIQLYTSLSISKLVNALKAGIYKVVPYQFLTIFEPHELQIVLCGPQMINVVDWRQNTQYKGYKYNDQVVEWFWTAVSQYDQEKLRNLLHYCTGSTRVPILGFKYLQSNRNNVAKFTIEKVAFKNQNPYPKSFTCFNRLQLPVYSSYKDLQKYLGIVVKEQLNHFGLD